MAGPISIWEFRCRANCDEFFASNVSLNQTIWDMQDAGWLVVVNEGGREERAYCPEHADDVGYHETWLVECSECDYDEECSDKEEAEGTAQYHDDEHGGCDCHWHNARVISPEEQKKRHDKQRQYQAEAVARRKEQEIHERYVDYLISQDQQRRDMDMQESNKPIWKYEIGKIAALAFLITMVVLLASVLLAGCSKMTEPFKDAPRGATNSSPADTMTFPDGFTNVATKCDHGNRVYSAFHGDGATSAIAVVPNAEGC